ncbi:hypothetical protein LNP74_06450 [Klebsiella pneumoniae subsp. pneumoniae]|nr:hypothetical protein [Klebsiella pneumoniae subsp. pneumoniae]
MLTHQLAKRREIKQFRNLITVNIDDHNSPDWWLAQNPVRFLLMSSGVQGTAQKS